LSQLSAIEQRDKLFTSEARFCLIAGEHAVVDLVERAGQVAHISRGAAAWPRMLFFLPRYSPTSTHPFLSHKRWPEI
jgi:transposase